MIPAGAFPEAAKIENAIATEVLGSKKVAFQTRADALVLMRKQVNRLTEEVGEMKQIVEGLRDRPF